MNRGTFYVEGLKRILVILGNLSREFLDCETKDYWKLEEIPERLLIRLKGI